MTRKKQKFVEMSVVIPCFNEAPRIVPHLHNVATTLNKAYKTWEIIAVNDGSADNTADVLDNMSMQNLRVITYNDNQGKGYAVRKGVLAARGKLIAYLDADGEIAPHHLTDMAPWLGFSADICLASKTHPRSNLQFSPFRRLMSAGYRTLNRVVLGLPVADTQAGCKVMTRRAARDILIRTSTRGFAFDAEVLGLAGALGYGIKPCPVRICHLDSNSSVSLFRIIKMIWETILIRGRIRQHLHASTHMPSKADYFAMEFGI